MGVLGCLMQWRSHLLGVPMSGRSDEWKSRCNLPPAGGKVAPPAFYDGLGVPDEWAFPMNGRPDGLGVPDEWAFRRRLFEGVAHTIFFGSGANDICWSGALDIFWSGAHDICWAFSDI